MRTPAASSGPAVRFRPAVTTRLSSSWRRRPICRPSTRLCWASGRAHSSLATRRIRTGAKYEMAGISHLPEPILPLGLPNQNTADARPVFRAAFDNLARWTRAENGDRPPRPGTSRAAWTPDRRVHSDQGCRRPFRRRSSTASRRVGGPWARGWRATRSLHAAQSSGARPVQPLRVYQWDVHEVRRRRAVQAIFFSHRYMQRVERAADDLAAQGYITNEDRKALIAAAGTNPCWRGFRATDSHRPVRF